MAVAPTQFHLTLYFHFKVFKAFINNPIDHYFDNK